MKKSFKLENLDCANCAAKMENAINKIDGVTASISFMSSRLVLEADEACFEEMVDKAQNAINGIERDCKIIK